MLFQKRLSLCVNIDNSILSTLNLYLLHMKLHMSCKISEIEIVIKLIMVHKNVV